MRSLKKVISNKIAFFRPFLEESESRPLWRVGLRPRSGRRSCPWRSSKDSSWTRKWLVGCCQQEALTLGWIWRIGGIRKARYYQDDWEEVGKVREPRPSVLGLNMENKEADAFDWDPVELLMNDGEIPYNLSQNSLGIPGPHNRSCRWKWLE